MAKTGDMILDWAQIGAVVAAADSIVQAKFFKGFAEGLKEYDTVYARQMQFAMARHESGLRISKWIRREGAPPVLILDGYEEVGYSHALRLMSKICRARSKN